MSSNNGIKRPGLRRPQQLFTEYYLKEQSKENPDNNYLMKDYDPNTDYVIAVAKSNGAFRYLLFKSYDNYFQHINSLKKYSNDGEFNGEFINKNYFEFIHPSKKIKMYLDFEIKDKSDASEYDIHLGRLRGYLGTIKTYLNTNYSLNLDDDSFVIQDSCGYYTDENEFVQEQKYKYSWHVIVNGVVFSNVYSIKTCLQTIFETDDRFSTLDGMDSSVYADTRLFRMFAQSKYGEPNRILSFDNSKSIEENMINVEPSNNDLVIDLASTPKKKKRTTRVAKQKNDAEDDEQQNKKQKKTAVDSIEVDEIDINPLLSEIKERITTALRNNNNGKCFENEEIILELCARMRAFNYTYDDCHELIHEKYLRVNENSNRKFDDKFERSIEYYNHNKFNIVYLIKLLNDIGIHIRFDGAMQSYIDKDIKNINKGVNDLLSHVAHHSQYGKVDHFRKFFYEIYGIKDLYCRDTSSKDEKTVFTYNHNTGIWEECSIQCCVASQNRPCSEYILHLISMNRIEMSFLSQDSFAYNKCIDIEKVLYKFLSHTGGDLWNLLGSKEQLLYGIQQHDFSVPHNPRYICMRNCVYDLSSNLCVIPHKEEYICNKFIIDMDYNVKYKQTREYSELYNKIDIIFKQILPDDELRSYVIVLCCTPLVPTKYEKIFWIFALNHVQGHTGANGKSLLLSWLKYLFTTMIATWKTGDFKDASDRSGADPQLMSIHNKRGLISEEVEKVSTGFTKNLWGSQQVRGLYESKMTTLNFEGCAFISANQVPELLTESRNADTLDGGNRRRHQVIPFVSKFVPNEDIRQHFIVNEHWDPNRVFIADLTLKDLYKDRLFRFTFFNFLLDNCPIPLYDQFGDKNCEFIHHVNNFLPTLMEEESKKFFETVSDELNIFNHMFELTKNESDIILENDLKVIYDVYMYPEGARLGLERPKVPNWNTLKKIVMKNYPTIFSKRTLATSRSADKEFNCCVGIKFKQNLSQLEYNSLKNSMIENFKKLKESIPVSLRTEEYFLRILNQQV